MKKTLLNTSLACVACAFSAASFANTAVTTPAGGAATSTSATTTPAAPTYSTGQVQGQLAVELTIGKGCEVVNGTTTANNFGTLSFGEVSALTSAIDGQAKGTGGGHQAQLHLGRGLQHIAGQRAQRGWRQAAHGHDERAGHRRVRALCPVPGCRPSEGLGQQDSLRWQGYGRDRDDGLWPHSPMAQTPGSGKYSDIVTMTLSW